MQSDVLPKWKRDYVLWAEIFALLNLAFLCVDIYTAHSANSFLHGPEYVPLVFSIVATILLIAALWSREFQQRLRLWRWTGFIVGGCAIVVGAAGVIYHLDNQFFYVRTLRSLTYAAPFAAPLAYTGVGMILVLDRMVASDSSEWPRWILFLTLGGFFGNFVLSLTDHASNGFFNWAEWIPVASSAFAVTFLLMLFFATPTTRYLAICALVLLIQALVGVAGFALHGIADMHGVSRSLFQNIINGAPPFAPLLLPNLALLGWIGLWAYFRVCYGKQD
jgi:hypothetical protein